MSPALYSLVVAAYTLADRWIGGGWGWDKLTRDHGGPLHGRPAYYAAPLLLALAYLTGTLPLALIWLFYRAVLGNPTGTLDGSNVASTFLRHGVPLALTLLAMAAHTVTRSPTTIVALLIYALAATIIAPAAGRYNQYVESFRGLMFGSVVVVSMLA